MVMISEGTGRFGIGHLADFDQGLLMVNFWKYFKQVR